MFKKFISVLCMFFGILTAAHAGPAANIEYVHKMIAHVWGLEIPYNPELKNPRFAANMEYLLAAVDAANERLNGYKATDYKSDPKYATRYIADTLVTNKAVHELIKVYYPFNVRIKTTDDNQTFNFNIAARGKFFVDWGDGTRETIDLTDIDLSNIDLSALGIEHTYSSAGEYTVSLGGRATEYVDQPDSVDLAAMPIPAISFQGNEYVTEIAGSLSAVFPTLDSGENPSFFGLFVNCQNLTGKIPEKLFAGIHGQPSLGMYAGLFFNTGISGTIPDGLFGELSGEWTVLLFMGTFTGCSGLTGEIPENLLGDLSGDLKIGSLGGEIGMFEGCTGLTGPSVQIDGEYLYYIYPLALEEQVYNMYKDATGLSDYPCIPTSWGGGGELCLPEPEEPTADEYPFSMTTTPDTTDFNVSIGGIGVYWIDWGDGNIEKVDTRTTNMETYADAVGVSHTYDTAGQYTIKMAGQSMAYPEYEQDWIDDGWAYLEYIPGNVFGIGSEIVGVDGNLSAIFPTLRSGQPVFGATFAWQTSITDEIPEELFANITGQPVPDMFAHTFRESGFTGEIPEKLFAGVKGVPVQGMFKGTFRETRLTGEIPEKLFAGISGTPAKWMFLETFYNSPGFTGIGGPLFAGISGAPAYGMFSWTFNGCRGLTGEIPDGLFGNISGDAAYYMFKETFANCSGLTGPSAKIGNKYLYEIWPDATNDQVGYMYGAVRGLSDWCQIPYVWRGVADPLCDSDAEFLVHVKTTRANSTFKFRLGAAGEFTVDWGDGNVETIVKDNTDSVTYTHTYANAGDYAFGISGQATAYPTEYTADYEDATFTFYINMYETSNANQIYNIRGSLGHVFGTLADGSQPGFSSLFQHTENLRIVVPENLFDGIYGQPIPYMFNDVFYDSGITGVAGPLFANISGTPTEGLYAYAFGACDNFSDEIPMGMFGNLTGDLAQGTFQKTFSHAYGIFGHSARDANGRYLYEVWPDATEDQVWGMYCDDAGLIDIDRIPSVWLGNCGPV